jgi:hypothetical protein
VVPSNDPRLPSYLHMNPYPKRHQQLTPDTATTFDLALNRQAGIAGFPNRPGHEHDHGGQWGKVAVAVVCAAVALATVQPWGRSIPRWIPLAAS